MACTVFFEVLAAEIHNSGHLSVDGIEAELFVVARLPAASCLNWQRQLEGLQEPRLVIIEVSDAIHRYSALSGRRVKTVHWVLRDELRWHTSSTHWVNNIKKIPTLLRVRGGLSGVLRGDDSLRFSEVELRDELLLEISLLVRLRVAVSWRKDSINSVGSLCPSLRGSCRCLCLRSLDMTCDSGTPNTCGAISV